MPAARVTTLEVGTFRAVSAPVEYLSRPLRQVVKNRLRLQDLVPSF